MESKTTARSDWIAIMLLFLIGAVGGLYFGFMIGYSYADR